MVAKGQRKKEEPTMADTGTSGRPLRVYADG